MLRAQLSKRIKYEIIEEKGLIKKKVSLKFLINTCVETNTIIEIIE